MFQINSSLVEKQRRSRTDFWGFLFLSFHTFKYAMPIFDFRRIDCQKSAWRKCNKDEKSFEKTYIVDSLSGGRFARRTERVFVSRLYHARRYRDWISLQSCVELNEIEVTRHRPSVSTLIEDKRNGFWNLLVYRGSGTQSAINYYGPTSADEASFASPLPEAIDTNIHLLFSV